MISIQQTLFNASPAMPQSLAPETTQRSVLHALGYFLGDHMGKHHLASFATPALEA